MSKENECIKVLEFTSVISKNSIFSKITNSSGKNIYEIIDDLPKYNLEEIRNDDVLDAEFVGYFKPKDEYIPEWTCPVCGMGVHDEWRCCPYCEQKISFPPPLPTDDPSLMTILRRRDIDE